jgi:hypothetical protein
MTCHAIALGLRLMPLGKFSARGGEVARIYEGPHASNLGALEAIGYPSCDVHGLR